MSLTERQTQVINQLQGGFSIEERPFLAAAGRLGCTESELIDDLATLLATGYLSRFGPLYDTERMGGAVTLAAMAIPPDQFDRIAAQINALPEVAHNYARAHPLNMWFVVAVEQAATLDSTLQRIEALTGHTVISLPKRRTFRLGFGIRLRKDGADAMALSQSGAASGPRDGAQSEQKNPGAPLTAEERIVVLATQAGLPVTPQPYHHIAQQTGLDPACVMQSMRAMRTRGVIRRLGVIPDHYQLGVGENGMTVWDVDDAHTEHLGQELAGLSFITHCYERPRHPPHWPYNVFAMVHGESRTVVEERIQTMHTVLAPHVRHAEVLYSTRILKKTGLRLT
jgi:DNA-binding Lrp family transcriptional regulator